jgi:hypothetical protein
MRSSLWRWDRVYGPFSGRPLGEGAEWKTIDDDPPVPQLLRHFALHSEQETIEEPHFFGKSDSLTGIKGLFFSRNIGCSTQVYDQPTHWTSLQTECSIAYAIHFHR